MHSKSRPDLEPLLSFTLLYEHRLEYIIDLLWWSVLAVTHPNAGQQDEPFHAFLCRCLYQVDVALHTTRPIACCQAAALQGHILIHSRGMCRSRCSTHVANGKLNNPFHLQTF